MGAPDPELNPVSFGADPTGRTDSTGAFQQLMKELLSKNTGTLAENIVDLGGATVDLQGGVYLINEPLVIPSNFGNAQFQYGTLRAGPGWSDRTRYMVEIGSESCSNGQHSCNMNFGFTGILFDSGLRAAGSIQIAATMGASIGPLTYHLGFLTAGVHLVGGHESMVHESWFGEFFWGSSQKENATALNNSVGVLINGNDHFVEDTICFSSTIGVLLTGAANLLQGVHTWNDATAHGGRGIVSTAQQNRFIGVYLDFTDLTLVDPSAHLITNAFFLGGGRIELVPGPHSTVNGLMVRDNNFRNPFNLHYAPTIFVNTTAPWASGKIFQRVLDMEVEGTTQSAPGMWKVVSPRVTRYIEWGNSSTMNVDFADQLPFPTSPTAIKSATANIALGDAETVPVGLMAKILPNSTIVQITLSRRIGSGAIVTVTVDQSEHSINQA